MTRCPDCGTPGAYLGFNTIECRNPKCVHFVIEEEAICPCCGKRGHVPGQKAAKSSGSANESGSGANLDLDAENENLGQPF